MPLQQVGWRCFFCLCWRLWAINHHCPLVHLIHELGGLCSIASCKIYSRPGRCQNAHSMTAKMFWVVRSHRAVAAELCLCTRSTTIWGWQLLCCPPQGRRPSSPTLRRLRDNFFWWLLSTIRLWDILIYKFWIHQQRSGAFCLIRWWTSITSCCWMNRISILGHHCRPSCIKSEAIFVTRCLCREVF